MSIPAEHKHRYLYHFTHIDNLEGLLKTGFLANNHPQFPRKNHLSIAAPGIQQRRAQMAVTCGPQGCVHDYVPLYFGSVSPMLLSVINAKNVDQMEMLYFEFPIDLLLQNDVVFTDASANTAVPPVFYESPSDLSHLDWPEIDSKKWSSGDKNKRMAEALVHQTLAVTDAARCIVWNEEIKKRVEAIVNKKGVAFPTIDFQARYDRPHWFTGFATGSAASVVTGPKEIARTFEAHCKYVEAKRGKHTATAAYADINALLAALRENFGCISHTAELVGLKSANGIHKNTVDIHTQEVVAKLLQLPGFQQLKPKHQTIVELAAYLHDIGKGPKSRWADNGGIQKVDPNHPVGAMPMMAEIVTEMVGNIGQKTARRLLKLVCYHDLVGDVLGKGRDESQIVDAADDITDLDLLVLLGQADASALQEAWNVTFNQKAAALRARCAALI